MLATGTTSQVNEEGADKDGADDEVFADKNNANGDDSDEDEDTVEDNVTAANDGGTAKKVSKMSQMMMSPCQLQA